MHHQGRAFLRPAGSHPGHRRPGYRVPLGRLGVAEPRSFTRALSLWTTPGREREQPYFGWMSTELPLYLPSTLSLKTRVHTQAVGQRPLIELEPTDHPLAVEQHTGITLARVQEIAETLLHALPAPHPRTIVTGRVRAACMQIPAPCVLALLTRTSRIVTWQIAL